MNARVLQDRLVHFFHSVRFRLALWFALILAAILLFFGVFIYIRESQAVHDQAVARLNERVGDLSVNFRRMYRDDEGDMQHLTGIIATSSTVLQPGEVLIQLDPGGDFQQAWGPIASQDVQAVIQQLPGRPVGQGFYYQLHSSKNDHADAGKYMFTVAPLGYENHPLAWIIMGQPIDPNRQLPRLLVTLVLGGLFTLLVAMAGGYWLADRALWPVKAITRTARNISETDLSQRLNIQTRDELGELAGTFDRMLDRLQAAFNRQRQFTADASHELRTPLTIIGLETDRALTANRSGEDYRRTLQVIRSENAFMAHLVGELLTLARMDAGQVSLKCDPLDLSDVTLDVVERYSRLAVKKGLQLQAGELPELPIAGDRTYLVQMISNLVENAIKYTPSGPDRWVHVETGSADKSAWVRVSDNGPGIDQSHLPHLFDRFYRVDQARSHNPDAETALVENAEEIPGSGLGLAIVQWIATMHHGRVTVQSQTGQGSVFEVSLPLAPGSA